MKTTHALLAWALAAIASGAAAQAGAPPLAALQARVDDWVQAGYEQPAPALAALDAELAGQGAAAPAARILQLGRGLVAAAAAQDSGAADAIATLGRPSADPLAAADAALVRATLADSQGDSGTAVSTAQAALEGYRLACPAQPGCDYRSSWRALQLLSRHEELRGRSSAARDRAVAAAELATAAGDLARQAWALAIVAYIGNGDDQHADEQRLLEQALRLAGLEGSPALIARVRVYETRMLVRRGHLASALASAESGLALAHQAQAPRLAALFQTNLSDLLIKAARPQAALRAVDDALPVVRRFHDRRTERVLMHNAALARVALGQPEVARRALDELLASYRASDSSGSVAEALREFADAFAAAGHLPEALALYHRERKLAAEIMAANREAALAELRKRFDSEAQQRQLDQLARDNALMSLKIDNRAATQKVWIAAAVLLALAVAMVALLVRRVVAINRRLAHNQAFLRAQSQRDPLTGLANRRGLHDLAAAQRLEHVFTGALLLIDVDHFKRVNDGHGHAAGDVVLVEVARRLVEVVRQDDLVVRWGGEEFLVYMPGVTLAQAQALADRVLQAVGASPVALPAGPLGVTVSVGYACFPLPPGKLPLTLERAINFADMALYTAKSQGRNRAIGIASALADDAQALRGVESDFDQAWHGGLVTLLHTAGPTVPTVAAPARQARPQPA
jgi:diguanylate cyclase (GGDEF)-like protein